MSRRLLFVHYTPPGVVGGVEQILERHARLLTDRGFHVEFAAGRRGRSNFKIHLIPEIDVARPSSIRLESQLDAGEVSADFQRIKALIDRRLGALVGDFDAVIAHNAFTLHFSLPLTGALWDQAKQNTDTQFIAWCHDLSWCNPLYLPLMHDGDPWNLLRQPAPRVRYVTVSDERRRQLLELWGVAAEPVSVIHNGIDVESFLRLSPLSRRIASRYRLFERDAVLLLPVRITRRKNIEAGIQATAVLRDWGLDVAFLISGPVAPHHPARSMTYLGELKAVVANLVLKNEVIFLADELDRRLSDRAVAELYALSDALLFPSSQEGFGLPILEAALARTPAVVSDIPIFQEVGGGDTTTFRLDQEPDTIAAEIMAALNNGPSRLYRRVLREYRWEAIADRDIIPLLTAESPAGLRKTDS